MDRYKRAKAIVDQISSLREEQKNGERVYVSIFDFDLLFDCDASKFEGLTQDYTYTPLVKGKKIMVGKVELVEVDKIPPGSYSVENDPYNLKTFDNYE